MNDTHLTEAQHLEQRITRALVTIRREWDAMMPTGPAAVRYGVGRSAGILGDNSAPRYRPDGTPYWTADQGDGNDVDASTSLVSLRALVTARLNSWSREVVDDRIMPSIDHLSPQEIREYLTKVLPNGHHVAGMCHFLERHAQWMSGHAAAEDMADELADTARRVTAVTQPQRREWINLGSCPLEIEAETDDGLAMVTCGGQVRAWPRAEDRDGEVMARCRRCGVEAVPSWWEARMFDDPELRVLLTAEEVVGFVHRAYGKVIKAATVRQWDKRGTIEPAGHDDKGRRLYARDALVWALDLQERREAMGL